MERKYACRGITPVIGLSVTVSAVGFLGARQVPCQAGRKKEARFAPPGCEESGLVYIFVFDEVPPFLSIGVHVLDAVLVCIRR